MGTCKNVKARTEVQLNAKKINCKDMPQILKCENDDVLSAEVR